jgi:hypothetical protein
MTTVYVTNRSEKPLIDEYAFQTYKFPVNEAVEVDIAVARHLFGYEQEDKLPAMVRIGLCISTNDIEDALKRLEKFEITQDKPEQNRFLSPGDDSVTPLVPKGRGERKVVQAA